MFKSFLLFIFLSQCLQFNLSAQIDCEEFYEEYDKIRKETFHPLPGYDTPPYPLRGYERFYKEVSEKTKSESQLGKIFVQFIIDTLGYVHCARVVKSENESLDAKAVELIKKAKFIPAKQRGKKIISTMILPISFGSEPSGKKKKRYK